MLFKQNIKAITYEEINSFIAVFFSYFVFKKQKKKMLKGFDQIEVNIYFHISNVDVWGSNLLGDIKSLFLFIIGGA